MPEETTKPSWLNYKPLQKESLSVKFFFEEMKDRFKLRLLAGEKGMDKRITDKNLHRPGLALAGYVGLFTYHRVQIFGNTEIFYLRSMPLEDRIKAFSTLASFAIPCIFLTSGHTLDKELLDICDERKI